MLRGREAFRLRILLLVLLLPITSRAPARAAKSITQCCANLDARIAELESTVVDKGARNFKSANLRPRQQGDTLLE